MTRTAARSVISQMKDVTVAPPFIVIKVAYDEVVTKGHRNAAPVGLNLSPIPNLESECLALQKVKSVQ